MSQSDLNAEQVLSFWFSDRVRNKWWDKDPEFDEECCERFMSLHQLACDGGLAHWRSTAAGRLAEIIVLDQFSRNMFRDTPGAFAQDAMARDLTRQAVDCGADEALDPEQRAFLYMPLMHSESPDDHELAVKLYSGDPALEYNLGFELRHKEIIDRFGRYPHRNAILGRESTPGEVAFLEQPGSSF